MTSLNTTGGTGGRSWLHSTGAIFAGLLTVVILSVATDTILEKTIFPRLGTPDAGDTLLALAFAYRAVISVIGGYVTARVAPRRPVTHAIILGLIGTALAALGAIMMWSYGHHWYPLALVVTALPLTWLGARFYRS